VAVHIFMFACTRTPCLIYTHACTIFKSQLSSSAHPKHNNMPAASAAGRQHMRRRACHMQRDVVHVHERPGRAARGHEQAGGAVCVHRAPQRGRLPLGELQRVRALQRAHLREHARVELAVQHPNRVRALPYPSAVRLTQRQCVCGATLAPLRRSSDAVHAVAALRYEANNPTLSRVPGRGGRGRAPPARPCRPACWPAPRRSAAPSARPRTCVH